MPIEIPSRGTRGSSIPNPPAAVKGLMLKAFERLMQARGMPLCYLTTTGARTGQERTVPLRPFPDGDSSWLVVGSLGGSAKNPAWLHNIAAHPDKVRLTIGADTFPVAAQTLAGPDREQAWQRITTEESQFAAYQEKTDRVIPVVRLTRVDPGQVATGTAVRS